MLRFHIPNMVCGGCVKGVRAAIQDIDPQAQVQPDLHVREVTVTATSSGPAALLHALKKAGYQAECRP